MKNMLLLDTLREIKNSISRFISIFAIAAIGVGFFAGVKASGPDMKLTANTYYKENNLMDLRIISSYGFNDDDIEAITNTKGVEDVSPSFFLDAFADTGDERDIVRIHTVNDYNINSPRLIDGRLPIGEGECAIDVYYVENGVYSIGDTITISLEKEEVSEYLATDTFKIVGAVYTPQFISYERGNTTVGDGDIDFFILITDSNLTADYFNEVYVTSQAANDVSSFSDEYQLAVDSLLDSLKSTETTRSQERYDEIMTDALRELNRAKKELSENVEELDNSIESTQRKFERAQEDIDNGYRELKEKEALLNAEISKSQNDIDKSLLEIEQGEEAYEASVKELEKQKIYLEEMKNDIELKKDFISDEEYQQLIDEYNYSLSQLREKEQYLEQTKYELEQSRLALDSAQNELNEKKNSSQVEIEKAADQLAASQLELNNQKDEFEDEISKAKKEISDAQEDITEAERDISKIEKPEWYFYTRDDNPGYSEYGQNAERIDAIASIFPVFFLLVAVLVCLTTMTRMIEEQRTFIGTLKALGYSKLSIASKYFIYANLAGLLGCITGLCVGFKLFPSVIIAAYGIMYDFPPAIAPFRPDLAVPSIIATVLCISIAVLSACFNELHSVPAELMRPKSPKAGKRVLMEKIPVIWERMSFLTKVTTRNLFRYKKRMLMTVIGISGCTALLVTGFGIKDSISDISKMQFDQLFKYDLTVSVKDDSSTDEISSFLDRDDDVEDHLNVHIEYVKANLKNLKYDATLLVPEDVAVLPSFINLRTHGNRETVEVIDEGAVITQKLSELLDVDIGDEINILDSQDVKHSIKIRGIAENYLHHYIYMTPTYYKRVFKGEFEPNAILANLRNSSQIYEKDISERLLEKKEVVGVNFIQDIVRTFDDIIKSLNYVVFVLIVSASLLAFVVLYNLTNINVTERRRELATIKVLGFYDNEVSAYIYRENIVLTFLGMFIGLGLGTVLHRFVMATVEINDMMFGRIVSTQSYVISGLFTIGFTLVVNFVLHFKLKKIDMVESLKSVE